MALSQATPWLNPCPWGTPGCERVGSCCDVHFFMYMSHVCDMPHLPSPEPSKWLTVSPDLSLKDEINNLRESFYASFPNDHENCVVGGAGGEKVSLNKQRNEAGPSFLPGGHLWRWTPGVITRWFHQLHLSGTYLIKWEKCPDDSFEHF